jgi:hypothetical protein
MSSQQFRRGPQTQGLGYSYGLSQAGGLDVPADYNFLDFGTQDTALAGHGAYPEFTSFSQASRKHLATVTCF